MLLALHLADRLIPQLHLSSVLAGDSERLTYKIVTNAFVHVDHVHLIANLIYLYFFGNIVCQAFGIKVYLAIGLVSTMASGFVSIALGESVAGASGMISGLMGAALAAYPLRLCHFAYFFGFSNGTFSMSLFWVTAFAVFADITGMIYYVARSVYYDYIAYWGHIAGFAVGFGVCYAAMRDRILKRAGGNAEPSVFELLLDLRLIMPRLALTNDSRRIVDTWVLWTLISSLYGLYWTFAYFKGLHPDNQKGLYLLVPVAWLMLKIGLAVSLYWTQRAGLVLMVFVVLVSFVLGAVLNWHGWNQVTQLCVLLWLMQGTTGRIFWPRLVLRKYGAFFAASTERSVV